MYSTWVTVYIFIYARVQDTTLHHSTAVCITAQDTTVHHNIVKHKTTAYNSVKYRTPLCSMVQSCTAPGYRLMSLCIL